MKTSLTILLLCIALSRAAELFHLQHPSGLYRMTYFQASKHCESVGASLVTTAELDEARKAGFSKCACGWTLDSNSYGYYPMTTSVSGCGNSPGLHYCDWSTTYDAYCFRGDTVGNCSAPLGMEHHGITGSQLAASSEDKYWFPIFRPSTWSANLARLNNYATVNAWMPRLNGRHQWIQVDLEDAMAVTGIITQGAKRLGRIYYVKAFTISYSKDGHNFKDLKEDGDKKIFKGNSDNNGLVRNMFPEPILTQYIRIHPYHWHVNIALRFELLGCNIEAYELAESLGRDIVVQNVSGGSTREVFVEKEPIEEKDERGFVETEPFE